MKHLHRCPMCGYTEEVEDCDCEDAEAPWYCGTEPFNEERCLELEEARKEEEEMSRELSTGEMNGLQLMRCPACGAAYIKAWIKGVTYTCTRCLPEAPTLQHINPFAIRRS